MRIKNITELKSLALKVEDGMQTFFPQFSVKETLFVSQINNVGKMRYAYNNSVVAFIDEEGILRVIPDINGTQKVLVENGYVKSYFYVPFSNWDYPLDHKYQWQALWKIKNHSSF